MDLFFSLGLGVKIVCVKDLVVGDQCGVFFDANTLLEPPPPTEQVQRRILKHDAPAIFSSSFDSSVLGNADQPDNFIRLFAIGLRFFNECSVYLINVELLEHQLI